MQTMPWFHSALAHGIASCALPVQSTFTLRRPNLERSCQPAPQLLLPQYRAHATQCALLHGSPQGHRPPRRRIKPRPPQTCCSAAAAEANPAARARAPAISNTAVPEPPLPAPPWWRPPSCYPWRRSRGQVRAPPTRARARGGRGLRPWAGPGAAAWPAGQTALSRVKKPLQTK